MTNKTQGFFISVLRRSFYFLLIAYGVSCMSSCYIIVEGCTDPDSPNYNPNATEDDGSCEESLTPNSSSPIGEIQEPQGTFQYQPGSMVVRASATDDEGITRALIEVEGPPGSELIYEVLEEWEFADRKNVELEGAFNVYEFPWQYSNADPYPYYGTYRVIMNLYDQDGNNTEVVDSFRLVDTAGPSVNIMEYKERLNVFEETYLDFEAKDISGIQKIYVEFWKVSSDGDPQIQLARHDYVFGSSVKTFLEEVLELPSDGLESGDHYQMIISAYDHLGNVKEVETVIGKVN